MKNPEDKIGSVLHEKTRSLVQHLTAIHGYLQLLQGEQMSASARELVRKLLEQDQRACAVLETLIGLEQSQKNLMAAAPAPQPVENQPSRRPLAVQPLQMMKGRGRVLLAGNDSATLEFQRTVLFHLGSEVVLELQIEDFRKRLLNEEFELVLIDEIFMPASQAEELSKWIVAKRAGLKERIVFLTAATADNQFEKMGFRILKKPLQIPELIQCSREFLTFVTATPRPTVQ